jgi:hypothetical protein
MPRRRGGRLICRPVRVRPTSASRLGNCLPGRSIVGKRSSPSLQRRGLFVASIVTSLLCSRTRGRRLSLARAPFPQCTRAPSPPSKIPAFNFAGGEVVEPAFLSSGVRISIVKLRKPGEVVRNFVKVCRLRDSNSRNNVLFRKRLLRQLRRVTPKSYPARRPHIIRRRRTPVDSGRSRQ